MQDIGCSTYSYVTWKEGESKVTKFACMLKRLLK